MLRGPLQFIPPIDVEILERRKAIPLSLNEGVYVRNLNSGEVDLVEGPTTFMLGEHEVLWQKIMEPEIEKLLN